MYPFYLSLYAFYQRNMRNILFIFFFSFLLRAVVAQTGDTGYTFLRYPSSALLSTKSEEEIDEYIATVPRTAYTLHTLTDGERLKQDLLAAKEKGYAEDISEISDSLHCVAVPILTPHGGLWAISLSGHCSVIREYGVENIVKHLKKAVWDMTSGYSAAPVA